MSKNYIFVKSTLINLIKHGSTEGKKFGIIEN